MISRELRWLVTINLKTRLLTYMMNLSPCQGRLKNSLSYLNRSEWNWSAPKKTWASWKSFTTRCISGSTLNGSQHSSQEKATRSHHCYKYLERLRLSWSISSHLRNLRCWMRCCQAYSPIRIVLWLGLDSSLISTNFKRGSHIWSSWIILNLSSTLRTFMENSI